MPTTMATLPKTTRGRLPLPGRLRSAAAGVALIGLTALPAGALTAAAASEVPPANVIVRSTGVEAAAQAVARAGGTVLRPLTAVDGVVARMPSARLAALATSTPAIRVTPDISLRLSGTAAWSPVGDTGSMYETTNLTGAQGLWSMGATGRGVGVALIDSGVAPVEGLTGTGKVVDGPDLSFDSQSPELQHIDSYGHGTH
ncbi:MAG TPA: hypothetical protein VMU20_07870, partial [Candidatus Dormibacteraeota bacterium]|nr:hypothetical protein [Candidatus Dormibacteraeota bacterium]